VCVRAVARVQVAEAVPGALRDARATLGGAHDLTAEAVQRTREAPRGAHQQKEEGQRHLPAGPAVALPIDSYALGLDALDLGAPPRGGGRALPGQTPSPLVSGQRLRKSATFAAKHTDANLAPKPLRTGLGPACALGLLLRQLRLELRYAGHVCLNNGLRDLAAHGATAYVRLDPGRRLFLGMVLVILCRLPRGGHHPAHPLEHRRPERQPLPTPQLLKKGVATRNHTVTQKASILSCSRLSRMAIVRCLAAASSVPGELAAWTRKRVHFVRCAVSRQHFIFQSAWLR